jgi:hypothetical protein
VILGSSSWIWSFPTTSGWVQDHQYYNNFDISEKWHEETNNFHMPIGEMTVTLDDVTYLLHIPIEGKMMGHEEQASYEKGVELMTWKQWGGYVGIPFLKRLYEGRLSKAI